MINIRHLLVVNLVMELGSVSAAARRLRISQPSITKTVRMAEQELGISLFLRVGGRLQPTPEARLLLPEVRRLSGFVETLKELADQIRDGRTGRIRIVCNSTVANSVVPEAVARFRALWPGVTVDVMAYATKEVVERVARNEADLGIADTPVRDPELRVEELCEAQMVCVMRADHPLAGHAEVRVSDLLAEPVIAFSEDTVLGRAIREALNERNPRYQVASTINQSTVACALVGQGVGVALIDPFPVAAGAFGGLITRPFVPHILVRPAVLRRFDRPPSQPALAFEQELRAVIALFAASDPNIRARA
ncbi:transcriptional regulator, LysR family [Methylobacterium sp. 4-46]|uniref:LysR family transcriptional regulator n=1 Tax=unclassified Methylobacterium TaxID=2615210 RepID=UPI000152D81E|nr:MULTISPECIES: LysR family transcriptional regulator [Methylobacterium]ACA18233.1 transcriptional regulator, LysR family [Methylobacterium sp. 4-46]WFT77530.1 LysR family transcriptional regulator [Methylobacterium nodulans]